MRWVHVALFGSVVACAYNPFFPDIRTANDRAREVAPRCSREPELAVAAALSPSLVEGVEPAYSYVASANDRVPRLRGARLRVRPEPSVSTESLQRTLECHEARVTMGAVAALSDDPFALPGTWLDINATSTGDGFVVAILVDNHEKAQQVLDRARRFAASRP